jgi:hypothetical protein
VDAREANSALAGRVAFVVGGDDRNALHKSLIARDDVAVPAGPSDLFGRGVKALFRNFRAGQGVDNGIAALADEPDFVRAVRRLTDAVYAAAMARHGAPRIVDSSPSNESVVELIRTVYPDAPILSDDASAQAWAAAPIVPLPAPVENPPRLTAPVFIVGVPRSGTTWLENMLLAHPGLAGPVAETSLFISLRVLRDNARRAAGEGLAGWIGESDLVAAIRAFVEDLALTWLDREQRPGARFLEKTPLHAEHLGLIDEVFPDAYVISIHRDGRDVVRSVVEMRHSATHDPAVAAKRWSEITRNVAATVAASPRARDLRYEAMLEDPVPAVVDLLTWLGLMADTGVRAEIARRAGERVSQYNTTGDVGSGKWSAMPAGAIRAVYRHAGDRLVELGYVSAEELARARSRPAYRLESKLRRAR